MKDRQRNLLINVIDVLARISDSTFIREHWGINPKSDSLVISCQEAIEILNGFLFFDLLKDDNGSWKIFENSLTESNILELKKVALLLNNFNQCDLLPENLIKNNKWSEIMTLSKKASFALTKAIEE